MNKIGSTPVYDSLKQWVVNNRLTTLDAVYTKKEKKEK